jgi:predicted amidophosphoribosyltransferase
MRQNYFFEYVPNAYLNLCVDKTKQMANNRFVYDFKAGDKMAAQICAEWLVRYLTRQYGNLLKDFIVVFAPCSSQWKYNKRFGYFAAILNAAGIMTANEHMSIYGERKPTHNGGSHFVNEDVYHVSVDGEFFKGKQVILFDDLLSSGKTIEDFRSKLEAAGAYVEREIFLARTVHHDPISNRGVLQEMEDGFYEAVARSKRGFPQGVEINKTNNNYHKVA